MKRAIIVFTCLFLSAVSAAMHSGTAASSAQTRQATIKIVPSNIFDELQKKLEAEPMIKLAALAKYGNDLLPRKGLDYQFDLCEFLQRNNPTYPKGRALRAGSRAYRLPMKQTDGRPVIFEARVSDGEGGLCGECFVSIPVTRVTLREIELVAGGRKYLVARPSSFTLDEISLVDQSMRRVLRTWQVDYGQQPLGVSSDGTKLYVSTAMENLILEISESAAMRILARDEAKLPPGEEVQRHPTDPKNAYLSFMRFRFGGRSLIVRYSEPCT